MLTEGEEKILGYLEDLKGIPPISIGSDGEMDDPKRNGLRAERMVYDILKKYTDRIFVNVVMKGSRKEDKISKMDFIAFLNGRILVVNVKSWYGNMTPKPDSNGTAVYIDRFGDTRGEDRRSVRTSPIFAMGAFTSDLGRYIKKTNSLLTLTRENTVKIVVLARDSLFFSTEDFPSAHALCYLHDLEAFLTKIRDIDPGDITEDVFDSLSLPGVDVCFDYSKNRYFNAQLMNHSLFVDGKEIPSSTVDSIYFDPDAQDKVTILFRDKTFLSGKIKPETIKMGNFKTFAEQHISFIKLDSKFHEDIANTAN